MKKLQFVFAIGLASLASLSSCSSSSSKLAIVHFDQTILGETQKDLGVSIAVKKGDNELKESLNTALATISSETRLDLMTKAVERSSTNTITNEEGKEIITFAPYDASKKDLIVGLECNYAPFNWTDTTASTYSWPIDGQTNMYAAGYDVSIARLLAEKLNYNLVIRKLTWESLIPSLSSNINCVIAGMTDTEERRQSVDFTNEYYRSELVLVVKQDSKYYSTSNVSLSSFSGAKFVSQVSTVTDDVITTWENEFGVTHLNAMDTFATCALAVRNGTADVMTAELPVAQAIVNSAN